MRQKLFPLTLAAAAAFALCVATPAGRRVSAQSAATGAWTLFPAQTTTYSTVVRPPIKADGSSVFRANSSTVIPVKFKLSVAPGAGRFESVFSNNEPGPNGEEPNPADDYAYLSFEPSGDLLFSQLTVLKANYTFTQGNCGGGSLRWQVRVDVGNDNTGLPPTPCDPDDPTCVPPPNPEDNDRSVFIYYGDAPNFTNCTTGAYNQSGVNLLGLTDLRFDTSQVGGAFYDTWTNAQSLVGSLKVVSASLVLDSGWMQNPDGSFRDQRVTLSGAQVNDSRCTPLAGDPTTTCNLPQASVSITRLSDGSYTSPVSVQPPHGDIYFRTTSDCTYIYNLDAASLPGPGTYRVEAYVGTSVVPGGVNFTLR